MQNFENTALHNLPCEPIFWKRYVDDIITSLLTESITPFFDHLKSMNHNIQFTLPYLDVLITRRSDGHLRFSVYRKPTHTNRYLDSESYHPPSHTIATPSTLFHRVINHCSIEQKQEEINTITKSLKMNGYAGNLINNCYRNSVTKNTRNINPIAETYRYISVPTVPYIIGGSERVGKILHAHGIKLGHKPALTLQSELCTVKDKREVMERNGMIYSLNVKITRLNILEK